MLGLRLQKMNRKRKPKGRGIQQTSQPIMYSLTFLSLLAFIPFSFAHSTFYSKKVECASAPPVLSYHVHIVYDLYDDTQVQEAMALRESAREVFAPLLGTDCDGRYDNGRLCMIDDHEFNTTLAGGPFPSGEWSLFTPVSYLSQVYPWFMQHHRSLSFLLHPNTGCEYEDHSIWAAWLGQPWPLNMGIFTEGQQTNEFNATRGDTGNPVCLPQHAVCGSKSQGGPQGACCQKLTCLCFTENCYCDSA